MLPVMIVIGIVVTVVVLAVVTLTGRAFFFMDGDLWWRGGLRPLTFVFVGIILIMMVIIALAQGGEFAQP
jgi:hypothetical protein